MNEIKRKGWCGIGKIRNVSNTSREENNYNRLQTLVSYANTINKVSWQYEACKYEITKLEQLVRSHKIVKKKELTENEVFKSSWELANQVKNAREFRKYLSKLGYTITKKQ